MGSEKPTPSVFSPAVDTAKIRPSVTSHCNTYNPEPISRAAGPSSLMISHVDIALLMPRNLLGGKGLTEGEVSNVFSGHAAACSIPVAKTAMRRKVREFINPTYKSTCFRRPSGLKLMLVCFRATAFERSFQAVVFYKKYLHCPCLQDGLIPNGRQQRCRQAKYFLSSVACWGC